MRRLRGRPSRRSPSHRSPEEPIPLGQLRSSSPWSYVLLFPFFFSEFRETHKRACAPLSYVCRMGILPKSKKRTLAATVAHECSMASQRLDAFLLNPVAGGQVERKPDRKTIRALAQSSAGVMKARFYIFYFLFYFILVSTICLRLRGNLILLNIIIILFVIL